MMPYFSLRMDMTNEVLRDKIMLEMTKKINKLLIKAVPLIKQDVRKLVSQRLKDTPEYKSLIAGRLRKDFGLDDAQRRVDSVIDAWVGTVQVKTRQITGKNMRKVLTINAVLDDYSDVRSLPAASVKTKVGDVLPWLEWLLLKGHAVIIRDYFVYPTQVGWRNLGRSGMGIMLNKKGRRWSVPEFQGTKRDNWVTRSLQNALPQLDEIVEVALMKGM